MLVTEKTMVKPLGSDSSGQLKAGVPSNLFSAAIPYDWPLCLRGRGESNAPVVSYIMFRFVLTIKNMFSFELFQ